MKKKDEVFVRIDTPKKAKKVKKLLDMFGEKINYHTDNSLVEYKMPWLFNENKVPAVFFNNQKVWIGEHVCGIYDRQEVSIKELRNILAAEHLREGDVIIAACCGDNYIVEFKDFYEDGDIKGKKYYSFDYEEISTHIGCFDTFIRYATEEEKALLNKELTIADYKLGVWYKSGSGALVYFNDTEYTYGFRSNGDWQANAEWISEFRANGFHKLGYWVEATKEEVEQALIKEAKKRYKVGDKVLSLRSGNHEMKISAYNFDFYASECDLWINCEDVRNAKIFYNGKWAEIVEPSFVESADKIKVAGENIGKRVRVIDGGRGATGCNGQTGIIVHRSSVDFSNYGGHCSTGRAECYIKTDEGYYWGLCNGYELEHLTESSPLTITIETKDIATLQVIQKTLKELEKKLTKLI